MSIVIFLDLKKIFINSAQYIILNKNYYITIFELTY